MANLTLGRIVAAAAATALLAACAQTSAGSPSEPAPSEQSILASSSPEAGSTVAAPVNELMLSFSPPARLKEVTVEGPEGLMPIMVTSVGEVPRYSLPVHGLGPGNYTVRWEASIGDQAHQGSFSFTAR